MAFAKKVSASKGPIKPAMPVKRAQPKDTATMTKGMPVTKGMATPKKSVPNFGKSAKKK